MKNVLIVGASIMDKQNAAGITLRSIFNEIDAECVLGLVWGKAGNQMGAVPFAIRSLSFRKWSIARLLDNSKLKSISHRIKKSDKKYESECNKEKKRGAIRTIISYFREWIALIPARATVSIKRKDIVEIKKFNPQVIYTVGETVTSLDLAYRLSVLLEIPIVIHFMDNWRHSIEWGANPLLKKYQRELSKKCDQCYSRTTACIAIGERMAEAYEIETGVKHTIIMNSVDTRSFLCPKRKEDGVVRFVYAGGLHLGREQSLKIIAECIEHVCKKNSIDFEFCIYTSQENIDMYSDVLSSLNNCHLHEAVPHDKILDVYKNADVLIHVENDSLVGNDFYKYSVSTKISEYLATGRTILFYGPENIYLYQFLKTNDLAFTASNADEAEKIIENIIKSGGEVCAQKAVDYAKSHFDIHVARERFINTINLVALPEKRVKKTLN